MSAPDARRTRGWLFEAQRLDLALYAAVAATPTPALDRPMRALTRAADHSKLWLGVAALLAGARGRRGRRAAATGLGAVAATSTLVNVAIKPVTRRPRPDPLTHRVPLARHVPMPASRSLPSGHAASAFAFATGVGHVLPHEAALLRALAAAVGYSRVHTGVHFPGDVLCGAVVGTAVAQIAAPALDRLTA